MIKLNKRSTYNFTYILAFLLPLLFCGEGKAQALLADRLDAVLSGMGTKSSEPDLDAVLSGMGVKSGQTDFDAVLEGMGVKRNDAGQDFDGVLAAMSITNALDYLDNAYSESNLYTNPYSYQGNGLNRLSGSYPILPGNAVLPISGRVTSRFGFRPSFGRMHKGVDIALQVGDTVVAAIDGTVERVSVDPKGYGIFVCLHHANGMETRYAHLSHSLVYAGMQVAAGQPIALGGNTGNSTGPHLHFETRVNGTALDPTKMFDFSMPGNMRSMRNLATLEASNAQFHYSGYNGSASAPQGAQSVPARSTYVVRAGDTIASVAKKNGVSVMSLCRLNMLSSTDPLQPGRMLKIR
ncbi:MAG: peptidoglycan DD-metalloendopeptidase family protein [Muribaculaceae bacterium]|nr:peptidoglycan DD-metalloendopeptidase family protein [Muribaculaceae bacterium]MDE6026536.1 peptidoglycan DD-metalloendopeptidase family protein [Muribaculaceae bacterium]